MTKYVSKDFTKNPITSLLFPWNFHLINAVNFAYLWTSISMHKIFPRTSSKKAVKKKRGGELEREEKGGDEGGERRGGQGRRNLDEDLQVHLWQPAHTYMPSDLNLLSSDFCSYHTRHSGIFKVSKAGQWHCFTRPIHWLPWTLNNFRFNTLSFWSLSDFIFHGCQPLLIKNFNLHLHEPLPVIPPPKS